MLNSSDLQLLAYHLQSSITLYYTFCDSVKSSLTNLKCNITKAKASPPNQFHYIKSFSKHTLTKASDVCRDLKGRVPEIRTVKDLRDLQDFAMANKVEMVRAAIKFDTVNKSSVSCLTGQTPGKQNFLMKYSTEEITHQPLIGQNLRKISI
jgi:hypothetical protein